MSGACERSPLCAVALATNTELRTANEALRRELDARPLRIVRVEIGNEAEVRQAHRERDEARGEADACRLYLWQRLPWKGYAS